MVAMQTAISVAQIWRSITEHAHPIHGGLHVGEAGGGRPEQVGDSFPERHARHGRRVDESLEGLLPDGRRRTSQPLVALRHHCHVRHRQLQRPAALLLRNQPCNHIRAPVNMPVQYACIAVLYR